jgi:type VI secretion system protein ImpC
MDTIHSTSLSILPLTSTEYPLLKQFADAALEGSITWSKSVERSLQAAISNIDHAITQQLNAIMHAPDFLQLEGRWRGLHHLVSNTETNAQMRIRMIDTNRDELLSDIDNAVEFDQSHLFKLIYEQEYGSPGGKPYAVLIGDYEFSKTPEDIACLQGIASIAASAFCPFISAAAPPLLGLESWDSLSRPRDLAKVFSSEDSIKWNQFREHEDARFISLTLPRVLARLPYGQNTRPVRSFDFEEIPRDTSGHNLSMPAEHFCWMNAAYSLGVCITKAQSQYGWPTAIRGAEGGGKITDLPLYQFMSDDGCLDGRCPTEVGITDRREKELSDLGFLPICHYKHADYAVFFGSQSIQKPAQYDTPAATANASISSRLPYILATSRFAHYLKVMARDKIGSLSDQQGLEDWLNRWILNYVNANPNSKQDLKAKYPLAEARIEVEETPGMPGTYHAIAWLKPWLQMESLSTSLRLVAKLPEVQS